jgi:hypothetical protein
MTKPRTCTICGVGIEGRNIIHKTCGAEACKKQHNIEQRARYREENRDAIREDDKRYQAENRDVIRERNRRYKEENRDVIREQNRRYKEENRYREEDHDAILKYDRRYYAENRESILEKNRCYQRENRDTVRDCSRRYQRENRDAVRERKHRDYLRLIMAQEIVRSFGVTLTGDCKARGKQALDILHELGITNQEIDQWIAQAQTQDDTNNNVAGRDLSSTRDSLSLTAKPTI